MRPSGRSGILRKKGIELPLPSPTPHQSAERPLAPLRGRLLARTARGYHVPWGGGSSGARPRSPAEDDVAFGAKFDCSVWACGSFRERRQVVSLTRWSEGITPEPQASRECRSDQGSQAKPLFFGPTPTQMAHCATHVPRVICGGFDVGQKVKLGGIPCQASCHQRLAVPCQLALTLREKRPSQQPFGWFRACLSRLG